MNFRTINFLGDVTNEERAYLDTFVEGIKVKSWKLYKGEPLAGDFPVDARIELQPEDPGVQLGSFLANGEKMLAFSRDVRAVVEKFCAGMAVEYLPFTLYDHRKRPYSSDYCIINPLGVLDCLDLKASDIMWSSRRPGQIRLIVRHVLDREKTQAAPPLFRVKEEPHVYVFRTDLAEAIDALKPTNIAWEPLAFGDQVSKSPAS